MNVHSVNSVPHMDEEGLDYFKEEISRSKCYLEYGCGGSTIYACNAAKVSTVISVDTDNSWINNVRQSLSETTSQLFIEHVDLGDVGAWGTPITMDCYRDFWRYTTAPWNIAKSIGAVPDMVLIDGRFRVACFLYTLIAARVGTKIMFDDYFDRPHYFVVEEFCKVATQKGRAAVFIVDNQYNPMDLAATYAKYTLDWS